MAYNRAGNKDNNHPIYTVKQLAKTGTETTQKS
jgi:hypothetical protein